MSINKYNSSRFASRLREKFPTLYGSGELSDDEINESWLRSHPEHIAHLTQEAQNQYLSYDIDSGRYGFKGEATQQIMKEAYNPTAIGDATRLIYNIGKIVTPIPAWIASMPAQTRDAFNKVIDLEKNGLRSEVAKMDDPDYISPIGKALEGAGDALEILNPIADASLNLSEYMRETTNEWFNAWMDSDEQLKGYYAWKENNPYSWDDMTSVGSAFRTMKNGMIDMAPSVLMMMAPGGIAKAGGMIGRGFGLANLTKASKSLYNASNSLGIGIMFAMEGGSTYSEAMNYLVDEKGMDPNDAVGLAGTAAALYAPVSTVLERMQFNSALRMLGLSKRADKVMLSNLMNTIAGKGGVNKFVKASRQNALGKLGLGALDISLNTFEQGVVEGWQSIWNEIIDESMKQGFGADPKNAVNEMFKAMHENASKQTLLPWRSENKDIRESYFSALFGSMLPGGFGVAGTGRKAYRRYLKSLDAAKKGGGFKVEVKDTRVTVFDKKGNLYQVYEAGSAEDAILAANDYEQALQDEAVAYFAEEVDVDANDVDDMLGNFDIDIEMDSFDSKEGYAKNLALQIENTLENVNKGMKPVDSDNLTSLEQLIADGVAYDDNVGLKALQLIKFARDASILESSDIDSRTTQELKAAAVVHLIDSTAKTVLGRLKPGKKVSIAAIEKALDSSPDEILAHVANGTYMNTLVPKLLKEAKIQYQKPRERKKIQTKEDADQFDRALQDKIDKDINSVPDISPGPAPSIRKALESKIKGKDFSNINSGLKNKLISAKDVSNYLKHAYLKSGTLALSKKLRQLNNTSIYRLAKELGLKVTKKDISTKKEEVLEQIAQKIVFKSDPINSVAETIDTEDDWRGTEEDTPKVKKKATKKKTKKAPVKRKRKVTETTKVVDEIVEEDKELSDDPVQIKKQIASIKRMLKRNEKLAANPKAKKEIKRLKTLLGELEVKLNAIEKAEIPDDFMPRFMFEGLEYRIDDLNNHIETISGASLDPGSELHKEIMERYISEQVDASRRADEATSGEAILSQQESGEAEAQEFAEEGEDEGWGVPSNDGLSAEELAELQAAMGTPGKGNVKSKSSKTKKAGKSAAEKTQDKIDDELCW